MTRTFLAFPVALALALALLFAANPAQADMSKKVIAAFKGKIVVSQAPLENAGDDKATIAKIKKDTVTSVAGAPGGDDVYAWTFVYTAFLTKASGTTSLSLEFWDGKKFAADQKLTGVDPKMTVLEGEVSITEDDGLNKGKKYTLKLVKGENTVLASTTIEMK